MMSKDHGMIDLRPYKLSSINTSLLNAGIFSRPGNQVRLSRIINQFDFLNGTEFKNEIEKRLGSGITFNIMINAMAFNLTPFGTMPTTFDKHSLDSDLSFVQLIYRNLGGDDTKKQRIVSWLDPFTLPSLNEMHRNTIRFIALDDRELSFKYENGTVTITKLYIHPNWIETLWNIVMLEVRSKCEPIVGTIANFYSGIIKREEDFNLAYQLGIIYGGPMNFTNFREIMYKISELSHYNSTSDASSHVEKLV
ncbi:9829_t:CDS:2 [Acaulospora colombiana]|uniref:9829_t:CDS:1 n=1 Tax=Acaulospora colombiana TaxID=27376 RepID=A0ACA9K5L5_9GLOM|nr:9829_t:CDS:2 [Acaulospora colombiana]